MRLIRYLGVILAMVIALAAFGNDLPVAGAGGWDTTVFLHNPANATSTAHVVIPGRVCSPGCDFAADIAPGREIRIDHAADYLQSGTFGTVTAPPNVISHALLTYSDGQTQASFYASPLNHVDTDVGLLASGIVNGDGALTCVDAFSPIDQVLAIDVADGAGNPVAARWRSGDDLITGGSIEVKAPITHVCLDTSIRIPVGDLTIHLQGGFGNGIYQPTPVPIMVTVANGGGGNAALLDTEPIP